MADNPLTFLRTQKRSGVGFVYFIRETPFEGPGKHEDPFICKIGFSKNVPIKRMKHLQTGNPRELVTVAYIEIEKYDALERAIHKSLKSPDNTRKISHIHGEWYWLTMIAIGVLDDELGSNKIKFIE